MPGAGTDRRDVHPAGVAAGLVLGALVTSLLGTVSATLVVPAAVVLLAAALTWRWRRDIAVGLAVGTLAVTAFFFWLFAVLGSGLRSL